MLEFVSSENIKLLLKRSSNLVRNIFIVLYNLVRRNFFAKIRKAGLYALLKLLTFEKSSSSTLLRRVVKPETKSSNTYDLLHESESMRPDVEYRIPGRASVLATD